MTIKEQVNQMQEQTVAKLAVGLGSGGTLLDYFQAWEGWLDLFVKFGNAMLIAGGIYLMFHKIMSKRAEKKEAGE